MNIPTLKQDLAIIGKAAAKISDKTTKKVVDDLVAWQDDFLAQLEPQLERLDAIDHAVDELLDGAEEGISPESASVLMAAHEMSRSLCISLMAVLSSDKNPFDDVTKKALEKQIAMTQKASEEAMQLVAELVAPPDDEDDQETDEKDDDVTKPGGESDEDDADDEDDEDNKGADNA